MLKNEDIEFKIYSSELLPTYILHNTIRNSLYDLWYHSACAHKGCITGTLIEAALYFLLPILVSL